MPTKKNLKMGEYVLDSSHGPKTERLRYIDLKPLYADGKQTKQ